MSRATDWSDVLALPRTDKLLPECRGLPDCRVVCYAVARWPFWTSNAPALTGHRNRTQEAPVALSRRAQVVNALLHGNQRMHVTSRCHCEPRRLRASGGVKVRGPAALDEHRAAVSGGPVAWLRRRHRRGALRRRWRRQRSACDPSDRCGHGKRNDGASQWTR